MWLWNSVARLFGEWPDEGRVIDRQEAAEILRKFTASTNTSQAIDETATQDESDHTVYHKKGQITYVGNSRCAIDNSYMFGTTTEVYQLGQQVSYSVHRLDKFWKVTNVKLINDEWNNEFDENNSTWDTKSLITKVARREERTIYISHNDMKIDLNSTASEFVPIVGDWLDIEVKAEVDEKVIDLFGNVLEVIKIRPLRLKVIQGKITQWNDSFGVIDRDIYFKSDEVLAGYTPHLGDQVTAEAIESEQGRCVWRALQVIPTKNVSSDVLTASNLFDCLDTIDNVHISSNFSITATRLNEKHYFKFDLEAKTPHFTLLDVKFAYNNLQSSLTNANLPIELPPNETVTIEGVCVSKNVGKSKELIMFEFENGTVGRWVNLEVTKSTFKPTRFNRNNLNIKESHLNEDGRSEMVRGPRLRPPARFIATQLSEYPLPQRLLQLVVRSRYDDSLSDSEMELLQIKPVLSAPLSLLTYVDRFHTLLHLEESIVRIEMTRYNQSHASLIRNGEFLMLEIPNLAERRPSLLVGDRIVVRDAYNENSTEFEGCIYKLSTNHVYLKFTDVWQDHYDGDDVSVRAIASRSMIRRLHNAVALALSNLGAELLFPTKIVPQSPQVNFYYDEYSNEAVMKKGQEGKKEQTKSERLLSKLKDMKSETESRLLLHDLTEEEIDKASRLNRLLFNHTNKISEEKNLFKLEWYNEALNYYQKEAVRNILLGVGRPLPYFIFGPPGTGKTVTLVEIILQLLRLCPHSRLLIATPSNSAADLMALRLIDSGVLKSGDMIRLVSNKYMGDDRLPRALIPYSATADLARDNSRASSLSVTQQGLALGCNSIIVGRHRITVSTCGNSAVLYTMGFSKGHFTHIIIDEAGQCMEPEVHIPLTFLDVSSGQAILAGDPMQLGPVIMNKMAEKFGLGESYLERLLNRFPYARDPVGFPNTEGFDPRLVTKLLYNYRSLPEILHLPNNMFYNKELKPTISVEDSEEVTLLKTLSEILPRRPQGPPAIIFHGIVGEDSQPEDSPSWFNPDEASQVFYYVHEMYRRGLKASDIGIITPYTKQVQQIRSVFQEAEFEVPKIGTVEDFQGQEYNVVILSNVRSNEEFLVSDVKYALGFVSNPRRLNVAITRAQSLMLIIGNPFLLSKDIYWRTVIEYCINNNSYCGCDFI